MTEKKESKAEPFTNRQTVDIEIGTLKGTVTIPIIIDDRDLSTYLEYMDKQKPEDDSEEELTEAILARTLRRRYESMRHMVKGIDFPGVKLKDFRPNGERPFPALVFVIGTLLDPLVRDALNLPNS